MRDISKNTLPELSSAQVPVVNMCLLRSWGGEKGGRGQTGDLEILTNYSFWGGRAGSKFQSIQHPLLSLPHYLIPGTVAGMVLLVQPGFTFGTTKQNASVSSHRVENFDMALCLVPRSHRDRLERPPYTLVFSPLWLRWASFIEPSGKGREGGREEGREGGRKGGREGAKLKPRKWGGGG